MSGSSGFHYSRSRVSLGDEWDVNWVERKLFDRVGIRGRPSLTGNATRHGLAAMSSVARLHYFNEVIEMLIANHGNGSLSVAIRLEHVFWPTTGGFRRFALSGEDSGDPTRDILRFLSEHGMNKWGPVVELMSGLSAFDGHLRRHSVYMVNVVLSA